MAASLLETFTRPQRAALMIAAYGIAYREVRADTAASLPDDDIRFALSTLAPFDHATADDLHVAGGCLRSVVDYLVNG
jgi:hypothetical protein